MMKRSRLLLVLIFCLMLGACDGKGRQEPVGVNGSAEEAYSYENTSDDYDPYKQEMIIVNKTQQRVYIDIGLSRNGKEPIEYIWRLRQGNPLNYTIMNAEIGDKGIVYLHVLARLDKMKLPMPNAENPPIIGLFWEVYWEKVETNLHQEYCDVNDKQWDVILDDKKYIILRPHILRDIETGEVIDLRDVDRRIFGDKND